MSAKKLRSSGLECVSEGRGRSVQKCVGDCVQERGAVERLSDGSESAEELGEKIFY